MMLPVLVSLVARMWLPGSVYIYLVLDIHVESHLVIHILDVGGALRVHDPLKPLA